MSQHDFSLDRERESDDLVQDQGPAPEQEVSAEAAGGNQAELQAQQAEQGGQRAPSFEKDEAKYFDIANQITSLMEGGSTQGNYGTLTTIDDGGGVSYGKHQVTLTSGTLGKVVRAYVNASTSSNAGVLRGYLPKVEAKDMSLKTNQPFLDALKGASKEREMQVAQDMIFNDVYWEPAVKAAGNNGITTPLGFALLYDTKIQGGMESVMSRARAQLGGGIGDIVGEKEITEQAFLLAYAQQRKARLLGLAKSAQDKGKTTRAKALRVSVYRCTGFIELIEADNLNVEGPSGGVDIKGPGSGYYEIKGFDADKNLGDDQDPDSTSAGDQTQPQDSAETEGDAPAPQAIGTATITGRALSVRTGPNKTYSRIGLALQNEVFEVFEVNGSWLKIMYGNRTGHIYSGYARFSEGKTNPEPILGTATITASALNVRSGPSSRYEKVGMLNQNEQVEVIQRENSWFEVRFSGGTGFIHGGYTNFTPSPEGKETTEAQPEQQTEQTETATAATQDPEQDGQDTSGAGSAPGAPTDRATVTIGSLNVRATPDTSQSPLGKVVAGTILDVIAREGKWLKVIYKDDTAFIHGDYAVLASEMPPSVDELSAETLKNAPEPIKQLLSKNPMNPTEVTKARELIGQISDEKQKGDLFEVMQTRIPYASQRDNASTSGGKNIGDVMCNLTSLAMVLQTLGVANPHPSMQYEDALEKVRRDRNLPARTTASGWGGVAEAMGVGWNFIAGPSAGKLSQDFWSTTVRNELRAGKGVMMSIKGHIVRVQGVIDKGVMVDDPYGASVLLGSRYTFEARNTKNEYSTAGDNNLWDFAEALQHNFHWVATFAA